MKEEKIQYEVEFNLVGSIYDTIKLCKFFLSDALIGYQI